MLGQPFVARNVPAAAGAVGMAQVANRATRRLHAPHGAREHLDHPGGGQAEANRQPAYTTDQLVPVARLAADPTVLVVRAESPWRAWRTSSPTRVRAAGRDLVLVLRRLRTLHTAMAMSRRRRTSPGRHVPFAGGGPAVTALLGGDVDALASGPGPVLAQIRAGQLARSPTGVPRESRACPTCRPSAELGYRDVEFYIWAGLFAPARTPAPIVAQLRHAVRTRSPIPSWCAR